MAIWDQIGKSVTQAASTAAQKTKDVTEMGTLKAKISQETHNLESAYLELGRQYAAAHERSYEPQYSAIMKRIADCKATIDSYEQRIRVLKGEKTCPQCGAAVKPGTKFCVSCGARVSYEQEQDTCPSCGKPVMSGAAFCASCGTRLQ